MMTDTDKFKQFVDELQKAVEQGGLPRDMLDFARSMLIVGGDMVNSQAIIGNNNVINVYSQASTPVEKKDEWNESTLLADALTVYREEKAVEQSKVSEEPYPGLSAYRIQDASRFFGREQAIAELTVELERRQVTWLHGRSGTGKSSLIQAGLMPALLKKDTCAILVRSVDESPTLALKKELLKRRWSNDLKLSGESLLQFLSKVDEVLKGRHVYIFFDQFEEFVIKLSEAKQDEFARELADCVADTSIPVHFIFSLRSDYFGETTALRKRLKDRVGGEYLVRSLKVDEARRAIVGPLERFGITYQDGLVDAILQHLGSSEVDSPQLQLVCAKLFHTLPEQSKQVTFAHYQKLGETKGIITDYLKQVLHDQTIIPPNQYKAATYILSTLVTLDGRRDIKRASDWYDDERLRLLTLSWRVDQKHLPTSDSALAMQAGSPVTVVNFIEHVKSHVSAQGEALRQFVNDILERYTRDAQKLFVDAVILSLRDARLLHEIQSEDGELSYELIHDYLVEEVKGWLDEDEQTARQLRGKLVQLQLDFNQHKLLLNAKELGIIASHLSNPKLLLNDTDKRLLLLSAAVHNKAQQWLDICGTNGIVWLRDACQNESLPIEIRQGSAAFLGELNDAESFHNLLETAERSDKASKHVWLDLLSRYLDRSTTNYHLPSWVSRAVFFKQAELRINDGRDERREISRTATISAFICGLITMLVSSSIKSPFTALLVAILYAAISSVIGFIFAQGLTSTIQITRKWPFLWQSLAAIGTGGVIGIGLFLTLGAQINVWFVGGIIALGQTISNRYKDSIPSNVLTALASALIFGLALFVLQDQYWWREAGYVVSVTVFSAAYLFSAERQKK
ncbi:ATP-binding protein [Candidatus Villigracilis affinis]|uniref:ATP-binding protein n=1 Tax=Candidatus Villigracilis affinis TaxID=3140682 RepID=UPI002A1FBC2E|nr:hypothetical protein [Anaerolineales bacterium]